MPRRRIETLDSYDDLPLNSLERRTIQNRNAQRVFRAKRQNRTLQLEAVPNPTRTSSSTSESASYSNDARTPPVSVLFNHSEEPRLPHDTTSTGVSSSESAVAQSDFAIDSGLDNVTPHQTRFYAAQQDSSPDFDGSMQVTMAANQSEDPQIALSASGTEEVRRHSSAPQDEESHALGLNFLTLPTPMDDVTDELNLVFDSAVAGGKNPQLATPYDTTTQSSFNPVSTWMTGSPTELELHTNDQTHLDIAISDGVLSPFLDLSATSASLEQKNYDSSLVEDTFTTWSHSIHTAAHSGQSCIIQLLLHTGCNANLEDSKGSTPLHIAAREGHTKAANVLINHGAKINATDGDGWTSLHLAIRNGHTKCVQLLLKHGAEPWLKVPQT